MPIYATQALARASLKEGERVWGMFLDSGRVCFVCATVAAVFAKSLRRLRRQLFPSFFEVIQSTTEKKELARLYLDVEIAADPGQEFHSSDVKVLTAFITKPLRLYLQQLYALSADIVVYESCTSSKLSLHCVVANCVLPDVCGSMMVLVNDFLRFQKTWLSGFTPSGERSLTIRNYLLEGRGGIDTSPYKSNQLFRALLSSKPRQSRPKLLLGPSFSFQSDLEKIRTCLGYTRDVFFKSLVTYIPPEESIVYMVEPRDGCPFTALQQMRQFMDYYASLEELTAMTVSRQEIEGVSLLEEQGNSFPSAFERLVAETGEMQTDLATDLRDAKRGCIDGDETVVLGTGKVILACTLKIGDRVFCPVCESVVGDKGRPWSRWERVAGLGKCSAVVVESNKSSDLAIQCFWKGCRCLILSVPMQLGYMPGSDGIVHLERGEHLNRRTVHIELENEHAKFIFIDSPMGTGKTELVARYLQRIDPETSVLVPTFRRSLATQLAQRLQVDNYLVDGFFDVMHSRCVVCVDSLPRLRSSQGSRTFDMLVLDECTFIQHHFAAGTMSSDDAEKSLAVLRYYILHARKVILLQYRIPFETICWFLKAGAAEGMDDSDVWRFFKVDLPPILPAIKTVPTVRKMFNVICEHYLQLKAHRGNCEPFVVFCVRKDIARLLTTMLRFLEGTCEQSRILGIWGGVETDTAVEAFLRSPNTESCAYDALICTSALQAGVSLELHFRKQFDILHIGVLTHREEQQLCSRLRYLGRCDMSSHKVLFCQRGGGSGHMTAEKLQKTISEFSPQVTPERNLLILASAAYRAESYDTQRRHRFLIESDARRAQVPISEYTCDVEEDVVTRVSEAMTFASKGLKSSLLAKILIDAEGEINAIQSALRDIEMEVVSSLLASEMAGQYSTLIDITADVERAGILASLCTLRKNASIDQIYVKLAPARYMGAMLDFLLTDKGRAVYHTEFLQRTHGRMNASMLPSLSSMMKDLLMRLGFIRESVIIRKTSFVIPANYDETTPFENDLHQMFLCNTPLCVYMFGKHPTHLQWLRRKDNKTRAQISHILCKFGLRVKYIRRGGGMELNGVPDTLAKLRCMRFIKMEHYTDWAKVVDTDLFNEASSLYESLSHRS